MNQNCTHLGSLQDIVEDLQDTPPTCKECEKSGDTWVHLTACTSCGFVGCCEESKNKHAHLHFRQTHHPIVRTLKPGQDWMWCYVDEIFLGRKAA